MSTQTVNIPRAQQILSAATVAFDATTPDGPEKAELRRAVEAVLRMARAQAHIPASDVDRLQSRMATDPWGTETVLLATLVLDAIPTEDYIAALISAGINDAAEPAVYHPLFVEAGDAICRIHAEQGPEAVNAPENAHWIEQLLRYAPDEQQGLKEFFPEQAARARVLH